MYCGVLSGPRSGRLESLHGIFEGLDIVSGVSDNCGFRRSEKCSGKRKDVP